ncbi:MAG: type IV pilus modification PilV family protein [Solirubrobacteraceae bacterium]
MRSDEGFLLIEVVISALIVGLIVVGTLTGLDVAQGTSISERDHNEATVLATESQEALKSDPASTFDSANNNYEHIYKQSINGETYKVTQQASFPTSGGEATACSATNTTRQESNSVDLTSTVNWPQQETQENLHKTDPPVKVSSVTTPPAASALEVDVGNYPTPTAGVSGMTAIVKYKTSEASPESSLQGTTEASGCVVFSSVPATSAIVEFQEKVGYVTPAGEWHRQPKEVTIAPNYTTHYPVTFNQGGAIKAEFSYGGSTSPYVHENNKKEPNKVTEPVELDTFVAYNELIDSTPNFVVGSAKYGNTSGTYANDLGTNEAATWAHTITTPVLAGKYPNGNLFPFPSPGAWKVYAGACTANDPKVLNSALADPSAEVQPASTTTVTVPTAYMQLNVYTGTLASKGSLVETTAYPVVITNPSCQDITPNEGTVFNAQEEENTTTTAGTANWGGHLPHPFMPLGPGELCLGPYTSGWTHYLFNTAQYDLKTEGKYELNIYLGELPSGYYGSPTKTYEQTLGTEKVLVTVSKGSTC